MSGTGWKSRLRAHLMKLLPFAPLVLLALYALKAPSLAFCVLAVIHLAALQALADAKRPIIKIEPLLTDMIESVDNGHKFAGESMVVTSQKHCERGGRRYFIELRRIRAGQEGQAA